MSKLSFGRIAVNLAVLAMVILWSLPTLGILVSSFRDKNQISTSGWWTALSTSVQNRVERSKPVDQQEQRDGKFVIEGSLFAPEDGITVRSFGFRSNAMDAGKPGETIDARRGRSLTVTADGTYTISSDEEMTGRPLRVFYVAEVPPIFTTENYNRVLTTDGIGQAFVNSAVVTIPATFIPILIAAFAAYALAWMRYPGRALITTAIVGLLVVPLQMSLIPLLTLYNDVSNIFGVDAKSYWGIWLAHTGFGLPLAIYLLRNYMIGLPHEIMESARMDGATHFQVFYRIVLPLSLPALASFAIFQFLWVWNDLLVAKVFLGDGETKTVLTSALKDLLGTRGGDWEILATSAFVTIVVPLVVFLSLQRYFVRGLLAGSVK